MKTQKELRRHLALVMSRQDYKTLEDFKRAIEEYLSEHKTLGEASDRLVRWTTPGTWTRFAKNCWTEYRQYREVFQQ